jgi:ABC-type multidrug transport system fused ATPase/permease subunit
MAQLVAPRWFSLLLALLLTGAVCLFSLAGPILVERLLTTANEHRSLIQLVPLAVLLLAATILQAAASTANGWLLGQVSLDTVRDLRRRLYEGLHQMPIAWFDRTPTGVIVTRFMDDATAIQGLSSGQALITLLDICTALTAAVWLASHSWRMILVVAVAVALYVLVFRLFLRPIHAGTLEVRHQLDRVFAQLKQKIDGVLVVRAANTEALEVAEFTRQITALHEPRLRVNQLGIAFSNLCLGIGAIGASLVFAVGAWEVIQGRLSMGDLIAASALAGLLFAPVMRLSELAAQYQQVSASFGRLADLLDHSAVSKRLPNSPASNVSHGGDIEFEDVGFHYLPERPILHDISLRIEPGTKVAIVGATGSGKTTLMNLLLRFYEPTQGEIRIGGRRLADVPTAWLRQHVGVVPQDPVVLRKSLADNIRYGTPHASDTEVEHAARAALLHELAMGWPDQYDTLVGEGGHVLSQGERQRIALARLFCKNPAIVVLDEATSSLDPSCEALVQTALDRLLAGRTTFVIAHRLATVVGADQILVMDQGRIAQMGTHAELLADETGIYRQLYDCQFAPHRDRVTACSA